MDVRVEPATAERWDDVVTVFGTRGDPARCWCSFLLGDRVDYTQRDRNRELLRDRVTAGPAPGLLAYRDATPVGWVAAAPRRSFSPRLERSAAMRSRPWDGDPAAVWAVLCFVVPREHRGQGVSHALLDGAVAYARSRGAAAIEGAPRDDSTGRRWSAAMAYTGLASMFDRAGFTVIARLQDRVVCRLEL
ncbi:MAG TPA: GNAT family N-acetyltransferase [Mycobacteriales bacterium]